MSCSQTNYKLDEAQAIFNELRSIKKAISTGEKERQDLIQVRIPSSAHYLHFSPQTKGVGENSLLTSSVCEHLLFCYVSMSRLSKINLQTCDSLTTSRILSAKQKKMSWSMRYEISNRRWFSLDVGPRSQAFPGNVTVYLLTYNGGNEKKRYYKTEFDN